MEQPIVFNDAMVRAILSGAKTETRRPIKRQPVFPDAFAGAECDSMGLAVWKHADGSTSGPVGNQLCVPGDTLWVREAWRVDDALFREFRCDDVRLPVPFDARPVGIAEVKLWSNKLRFGKWAPSIHMPRWAARTVLDVLEVRVERLQDMSEADARAEGFVPFKHIDIDRPFGGDDWRTNRTHPCTLAFAATWDAIYPTMPWASNPWVWVVRFKRQGGA